MSKANNALMAITNDRTNAFLGTRVNISLILQYLSMINDMAISPSEMSSICAVIELKSVSTLLPIHLAQLLNYMKAMKLEHGLLINFGSEKFQCKKVANSL